MNINKKLLNQLKKTNLKDKYIEIIMQHITPFLNKNLDVISFDFIGFHKILVSDYAKILFYIEREKHKSIYTLRLTTNDNQYRISSNYRPIDLTHHQTHLVFTDFNNNKNACLISENDIINTYSITNKIKSF
jgi:hypothetical protein